jgi:alpha-tubulin suppressor-like RCC1 family protein
MRNLVKKILKHEDTWAAPANVTKVRAAAVAYRGLTIAAATSYSAGITLSGDAYAWGAAGAGQLGNGTTTPDQTTPSLVLGGHKWVSLSGAAGIASDGNAYCWGESENGRLGNGTTTPDATIPSLVLGGHKWIIVASGAAHRAGVTESGVMYCWGSAANGRLGNDTTTPDQTTPSLVHGGYTWTSVSCGTGHSIGLTTDGDAYAWGLATSGQLGNGTATPNQTTPSLVLGGHKWIEVRAGGSNSAGITLSGDAYAWGAGSTGQLGNGATASEVTPSQVLGGHKWSTLSVGSTHMAGITLTGDMYAWGDASYGKLGDGTTAGSQTTPVLVLGGHKWVSVSVGSQWSMGITTNGDLYAWGASANGRLGNGTTTVDQTTPALVLGGHKWSGVSKTIVASVYLDVVPGETYAVNALPWSVAFGKHMIYQDTSGGYWVELELEYEA